MTILLQQLAADRPKYRAIADALRQEIRSGRLPQGSQLPPQRELAFQLGVTVGTVSRSYAELIREGLVSGEVGRGSYVSGPAPFPGASPASPAGVPALVEMDRNSPSFGPHAAVLETAMASVLRRRGSQDLLDYWYRDRAMPDLRAAAGWIAKRGLRVAPESLLITAGAQQALACALGLAPSGAPVLLESHSYFGALDLARAWRRPGVPVALDEEGLRPDALEDACRASGARVLLVVPTLQNPTGAVMSEARRRAMAKIAREWDLLIIEDDLYGLLVPDAPPPIACFAPERTIYISSASKTLIPGLRVGWMAVPERWLTECSQILHSLTVAPPALNAAIITALLESGQADELLRWQIVETEARQRLAREALPEGTLSQTLPSCPFALLRLPQRWRADSFVAAARQCGVATVPAARFAVDAAVAMAAVRLSLAAPPDRDALRRGLAQLRGLLEAPAPVAQPIV